ncbi:methyltransferase domain-containing protein [Aquihabitans sp. McL0605]|uniref:class I SAM-dependent methyltransferase n=1 Tax=Aquihabitans sp. McL0605 TaxID=3415671 RepID=UPI003CED95FD
MTDTDEVLLFLHRAKARVEGGATEPAPVPGAEAVRYTRDRLEEALPYAHAGAELPEHARLRPVKQAMLGAVRPVTSNQGPFNKAVLQALDGAAAAIEGLAHTVDLQEQHANRLQAGVATTDLTIDDLVDDVRALRAQIGELTDQLGGLHAHVAEARSDLATLSAKQDLIFRTAREGLAAQGLSTGQLTELTRELSTGFEQLYEDLEDHFRGTREVVQGKLSPYLADIRATAGTGPVIDVGCGRGEWLDLLRTDEVTAYGVDINAVVVERCQGMGLDVREADALVHLREIPEGSARAITSFHVAEHLSLDTLIGLVDAALVALQPGGILIFETPNPTNVNVGAASFYLDPTHLKPLHPQFLEFLVAQRGFAEAEVRYLNIEDLPALTVDDLAPNGELARSQALVDRVNWALSGPLDYCVVARKAPATA